MTAPRVPATVLALIRGPVSTMAHVEALMLLRSSAPEAVSPSAIALRAQLPTPQRLQRCLDELTGAGLVESTADAAYRYAPRSAPLDDAVRALATMYHERPVTLVNAIYARVTGGASPVADPPRSRPDAS